MDRIKWTAGGGQPTRRGFGSKLIHDVLPQNPEWAVDVSFEPAGLKVRIRLHLSAAIIGATVQLQG
jgi:hypothetical protein